MKLNYKFSNLLGCFYRKGNLEFSRDGSMKLYSPVGNRISVYDLKNNRSETLPCESNRNIETIAISHNNTMMIAIDEAGFAMFINLVGKRVIHTHEFRRKVNCVSFSPDGRKFAVAIDSNVVLYRCPGVTPEVNPFIVEKRFNNMHDTVTCIDWSSDSKVMCVGSKDMNTYIICTELCANLSNKPMGGLKDAVVGCFFMKDSLDFMSLSELGELCIWRSDTELNELIPGKRVEMIKNIKNSKFDDDEFNEMEWDEEEEEDDDGEKQKSKKRKKIVDPGEEEKIIIKQVFYEGTGKLTFKKLLESTTIKKKKSVTEATEDDESHVATPTCLVRLRACDYHKNTRILVTAFTNGAFYLHEMPSFQLMHKLSASDQMIGTVRFNDTGDWVAVGCPEMGQLLVWEWMSESCVLKQQGHYGLTNCLDYSPDGRYIASGGEDGKVKLWDLTSGNCFVTFTQHSSCVTGVVFKSNGQAFVTSSLDGTVRAFDMIRYRNFRTFTAPDRTSTQFFSVALDAPGEIVCAGARDTFDIYMWSMKTAMLINVLTGHEGPVCTLSFSNFENLLASGSWDHTVRLWPIFSKSSSNDVIALSCDVLSISFRPDGQQIAVATLDGVLSFWDVKTTTQVASIEAQKDLGYSRKEGDKITAKTSSLGKSFRTLCYTADGKFILAAGQSKFICIFSVEDQLLLRRFEVTCNLSLNGTQEFLDRRRMTEFGSMSLVEEDDATGSKSRLALPGVTRGEFSSRTHQLEVRVNCVKFSPTGMSWIASTTEGILVYSLNSGLGDSFDPFELDLDVTPQRVNQLINESKFKEALMLALRLNSLELVQKVMESVPLSGTDGSSNNNEMEPMNIDDDDEDNNETTLPDSGNTNNAFDNYMTYISSTLPVKYINPLLRFLSVLLETSRHVEFYSAWAKVLLVSQTARIKQAGSDMALVACLAAVEKSLKKSAKVIDICEQIQYSAQFLNEKAKYMDRLLSPEEQPTD